MEFSRQQYWSGLPFPPPGDLPDPGIEPMSLMSPAVQVDSITTVPPGKPLMKVMGLLIWGAFKGCLCLEFTNFTFYSLRRVE